jgi:hypothetical protein
MYAFADAVFGNLPAKKRMQQRQAVANMNRIKFVPTKPFMCAWKQLPG